MHHLKSILFRRSRLIDHAWLLILMDRAIVREGGLEKLSDDELRMCCYIRGLEASTLSRKSMIEWLKQWIMVSSHLANKSSASVILHAPVLLGYNQPSNWAAIYEQNKS